MKTTAISTRAKFCKEFGKVLHPKTITSSQCTTFFDNQKGYFGAQCLLYNIAKGLFQTASMNLGEWTSNCKEFRSLIPNQLQAVQSYQKVLEVYWNTVDDVISIPNSDMETTSTKREILQHISSVFDPLGYFSPMILKAKLFMKKLWADKCKWNERISNEHLTEWTSISEQLKQISTFCLPRYIGVNESSESIEYHLVCFCDASAIASATAVQYIYNSRIETPSGLT